MESEHNDPTSTLLEALTEVVQKLEDSRLDVGPQEVKAVDQKLITIRAISNHSAPIHRIPAEILAHVFKYACTRPRASAESMLNQAALIAITHVCRRWRAVALGCGALWSHIFLCQKSALAFEKRSQTSPLTVYVSVRRKDWERKMAMLRCLLPRVQTLRVRVTDIEDLLKLENTLSSPHIASLTLQVNPGLPFDGMDDSLYNLIPHDLCRLLMPKPSLMFGGLSPSLRSLSIIVNDICWYTPSGHFSGLTSLRLIHDGMHNLFNPKESSHLLSLLSNTPNLEDLEVRTVSPFLGCQDLPCPMSEQICLARLRRLTIATSQALSIYSRLSVRENTMVTLVGLPSLFPSLDQHLLPGPFTEVELLYRAGEVVFRARNAYRYIELCIPSSHAPFTEHNYPRYLTAIKTLSLNVSSRIFPNDRIWPHLLAFLTHAPLLEALYIRDVNSTTISRLVRVLTHPDPAPAPCPQLRTLTLSLVEPSGCLTDLKPLLRATEERARRGVPLESVTLCSPRHRTLNPSNVLFNFGGVHGLEWLLLCDRDLYRPFDSDAHDYSDFRKKAVRKFRRHWVARARKNEDNDSDRGDVVDA